MNLSSRVACRGQATTWNREFRASGLTKVERGHNLQSEPPGMDPGTALTLGQGGFRMSTRTHEASLKSLQLPMEFEDLTGVIQNDLKVIVSVLTQRATERL